MQWRHERWPEKRLKVRLLWIWSTTTRSNSCSSLSLALTLTSLALAPAVARAQRVTGALSASATILPPIMTQPAALASFSLERNGMAHLETTRPIAGAVSLIVMTTVSSSANGFVPVAQPPALVKATHRPEGLGASTPPADAPGSRWHYEVPLAPSSRRAESGDVSVRISYLIVPGT